MNKISLTFILFFLVTSMSFSQYAWNELIYHYQTGSIPPPYYYSYDLNINSGGSAVLVYSPGYEPDTTWRYNITCDESTLKKLNDEIIKSKVLTEEIESLPNNKRPIGGSLMNIIIVMSDTNPNLDQSPKRIITPFFPTEEYKDRLDSLYDFVKSLVSQKIWSELEQRREDFTKSHK